MTRRMSWCGAVFVLAGVAHADTVVDKTLVVTRGVGASETYQFRVTTFEPVRHLARLTQRPSPPVNSEELATQFVSAILHGDRSWYEALWDAQSYLEIASLVTQDLPTWSGALASADVNLVAEVQSGDLLVIQIELRVTGRTERLTLDMPALRNGSQVTLTNQFAEHPVHLYWQDADGEIRLPAED